MGFTQLWSIGKLFLKKHGPEIATGAGVVGVVVSTVWSCRQTLKVQKIVDESNELEMKVDKVLNGEVETTEKYTEEDAKKDLTIIKTQKYIDIAKLYVLPAALGAGSIVLILYGHSMLRKENAALAAAFTGLSEAFREYRNRVKNDIGEDKDREYFTGVKMEDRVEVDEVTGETKTSKREVSIGENLSIYAKEFNDTNPNFNHVRHDQNIYFLKRAESMFNDLLKARGHIFLNEVYDYLRIPRTYAGQFVGWVSGHGDDCINFGVDRYFNELRNGGAYADQTPRTIYLDFNVDGEILYIFEKTYGRDYAEKLIHGL